MAPPTCCICGSPPSASAPLLASTSLTCGHLFCPPCADAQLSAALSFPCPAGACAAVISRGSLAAFQADDKYADNDATWRRRVKAVYNSRTPDFASLREYNDYLEEVEDVIFSIVSRSPSAREKIGRVKELEQSDATKITIRQSERAEREQREKDEMAREGAERDRRRLERAGREEDERNVRRRLRREKQELELGDRDQISEEMERAEREGVAAYARGQSRGGGGEEEGAQIFVFEPPGGLRSRDVVGGMGRDAVRMRAKSAGRTAKGSVEDHEECWREAVESVFLLLGGR